MRNLDIYCCLDKRLTSMKKTTKGRSGSLSRNTPPPPEVRTPELTRLGKKTKSISNITKGTPDNLVTNHRGDESYNIANSRESLDSSDKDPSKLLVS